MLLGHLISSRHSGPILSMKSSTSDCVNGVIVVQSEFREMMLVVRESMLGTENMTDVWSSATTGIYDTCDAASKMPERHPLRVPILRQYLHMLCFKNSHALYKRVVTKSEDMISLIAD